MGLVSQNGFALLEAGAYTLVLATLLGIFYVFPHLAAKVTKSKTISSAPLGLEFESNPGLKGHQSYVETAKSVKSVTASPVRNWWIDENTFQLERRAIFSKTWLFVTHTSRFQKPGDYRTFEIAGFSFIIIMGKDRRLRAFHNVCRHRAYAVTKKESGSSIVLGCRYHGWSYDSQGKLIKAPEFENVRGFDKEVNGLWEVKLDLRESLVFVNFNTSASTSKLDFHNESKILKWNVGKMQLVTEWKVEGKFNWKLAEGNISLGHLALPSSPGKIWSTLRNILEIRHEEVVPSHSAVLIRLTTGKLLTVRLLPLSKSHTTMECNLYAHSVGDSASIEAELEKLQDTLRAKIKGLEAQNQIILSGKATFDHEEIRNLLDTHLKAEKSLGIEIQPAARKQTLTKVGQNDDNLCRDLETNYPGNDSFCNSSKEDLEW